MVAGHVDLRRLCEQLGIAWEPTEEVATIGGLMTETLERIPIRGDSIPWNGYDVNITMPGYHHGDLLRLNAPAYDMSIEKNLPPVEDCFSLKQMAKTIKRHVER